ncbi:hypothetical protein V6R21_19895 [Limibacter armeniacum]|uniref:hypothetical protein n=1 Tax=Limibacter armeniacum TaxID=466084 RepID=UPI002FE53A42
MHGFTHNNGTFYSLPKNYNELTRKQLLNIIRIRFTGYPDDWKKYLIIRQLIPIFHLYCFRWPFFKFTNVDLVDWQRFFSYPFLYEKPILTRAILDKFRIGGKTYYGPSDNCANLTFVEFIKCETFLERYRQTSEEHWLHSIIAVLYRPKKNILIRVMEKAMVFGFEPSDDIRQKYNDALLAKRAEQFAKLAPEVKEAVLIFYESCRHNIITHPGFNLVFKKNTGGEGKSNKDYGWAHVLKSRAEKADNFERWEQLRLTTVLFDLNEDIRQQNEREAKLNNK